MVGDVKALANTHLVDCRSAGGASSRKNLWSVDI